MIHTLLIFLFSSALIEAETVTSADQIFTVLIQNLVSDQKTEELCKLGKQLHSMANEVKNESDMNSMKEALEFWKKNTVKIEDFKCQLPTQGT